MTTSPAATPVVSARRYAGGGVFDGHHSVVSLTDVNLTRNVAQGGAGGNGGAAGGGGKGGTAYGGGLFNGAASTMLTRVSLTRNQALGGAGGDGGTGARGGDGGDGLGGGAYTSDTYLIGGITPFTGPASLTVLASTFTRNEAVDGDGGTGGTDGADGSGIGGGLYIASPTVSIDATTTFVKNKASTDHDDVFGP